MVRYAAQEVRTVLKLIRSINELEVCRKIADGSRPVGVHVVQRGSYVDRFLELGLVVYKPIR